MKQTKVAKLLRELAVEFVPDPDIGGTAVHDYVGNLVYAYQALKTGSYDDVNRVVEVLIDELENATLQESEHFHNEWLDSVIELFPVAITVLEKERHQ